MAFFVSLNPSIAAETVFFEDFSADAGWTTTHPEKFKVNAENQWYEFSVNDDGNHYYAFKDIEPIRPLESFEFKIAINPHSPAWGTYPSVILTQENDTDPYDSDLACASLRVFWADNIWRKFLLVLNTEPRISLVTEKEFKNDTWYSHKVKYDSEAKKIKWEVFDNENENLFYTEEVEDVELEGFSRIAAGFQSKPDYGSWATTYIDNIEVDSSSGKLHYYLPYMTTKQNHWTGLALSNEDGTNEGSVEISIYNQEGVQEVEQVEKIGVNENNSFLIGQNKMIEGWVEVTSSTKLTGLAFFGVFGQNNYMADIPISDSLESNLTIPHVAQDAQWDTTIMVCNPNNTKNALKIQHIDSDGMKYPPHAHEIPANGSIKIPFSTISTDSSGRILLESDEGISAFALYDNLKFGGKSFSGIAAIKTDWSIIDVEDPSNPFENNNNTDNQSNSDGNDSNQDTTNSLIGEWYVSVEQVPTSFYHLNVVLKEDGAATWKEYVDSNFEDEGMAKWNYDSTNQYLSGFDLSSSDYIDGQVNFLRPDKTKFSVPGHTYGMDVNFIFEKK